MTNIMPGWTGTRVSETMENVRRVEILADEMKSAREQGALFHSTNPPDTWFCTECSVFGREEKECWSCGSDENLKFRWVPRFGGGAQSWIYEEGDSQETGGLF